MIGIRYVCKKTSKVVRVVWTNGAEVGIDTGETFTCSEFMEKYTQNQKTGSKEERR